MKEPLEEYKYKKTLDLNEMPPSSKGLIKVCCPACDQAVPAININVGKEFAKCDHCEGIFSYSDQHEVINHNNSRPKVMQPEGVEIFHFQNELDISFKQSADSLSIIMLLSLAPSSFIFLLLAFQESLGFLFAAIPMLLVTIFFSLRLIASLRNKTYITVDDQYLSIVNRPFRFPFTKDNHYNINDFDQVYIKKQPPVFKKDVYAVYAILNTPNGQKHVKLSPTIESKSKAKYIEQEIEHHLGITDRPVPEED